MTRALVLALVLCAACDSPAKGLVRYEPPAPIYAAWWSKMEACAGLPTPMAGAVKGWWFTAHNEWLNNNGEHDNGLFLSDTREIAIQSSYRLDEKLVSHEMLHAILFAHRLGTGHPAEYFVTRCGLGNTLGAT